MGVGLMLKIRCFHSFYLLILSLYLPLVMVFVVVIWLLVLELVTTGASVCHNDNFSTAITHNAYLLTTSC